MNPRALCEGTWVGRAWVSQWKGFRGAVARVGSEPGSQFFAVRFKQEEGLQSREAPGAEDIDDGEAFRQERQQASAVARQIIKAVVY